MHIINRLQYAHGESGTGGAIAAGAKRIGCEEAVLEAILEVESGGKAFDAHGRLIILPEKHVFWRLLPKNLRRRARAKGLAAPRWSRLNYKGLGGAGSDERWRRLRAMTEMDETAGLKSASYGGPQIMGFNHRLCGFDNVRDFVLAMAAAEDNQHTAFIRYLESVGLASALREKDFSAIARRYNGSGQVERYASMIGAAYRRIAVENGRKPSKAHAGKSEARTRALGIGAEGYRVKALQEKLVALGYHVVLDGDFGPATRRAVIAFQADYGIAPDGLIGPKTEAALVAAVPVNAQPGGGRASLKVRDLRRRGSQTIQSADWLTRLGGTLLGAGGLAEGVDANALDGFSQWFERAGALKASLLPLITFFGDNPWLLIALAGLAIVVIARRIKQRRLYDAREWRHVG